MLTSWPVCYPLLTYFVSRVGVTLYNIKWSLSSAERHCNFFWFFFAISLTKFRLTCWAQIRRLFDFSFLTRVEQGINQVTYFVIVNWEKWLGNVAKFFVVCFCWLFWRVDPAQDLKYKIQKMIICAHTTNQIEVLRSCIVSEHTTKVVQGQGPSNINLSLFVLFFDIHQPS